MDLNQNQRFYSLDALRAIMMLLGIVLHAGITYGVVDLGAAWNLKDSSSTHLFFDVLGSWIHVFRMPVFFVVAGFFGALLFYRKGPASMIRNRLNRITLPFIAATLIVYPLVVYAFVFSGAAFAGHPEPFLFAADHMAAMKFLPFQPAHLWFLYYLSIFSILSWILATAFKTSTPFTSLVIKTVTSILGNMWMRIILITSLLLVFLLISGTDYIRTNAIFKIEPVVLATYFLLYGTGWFIFRSGTLESLKRKPHWHLAIATLIYFIGLIIALPQPHHQFLAKQILTALSCTLYIFGFIGLFQYYFNDFSARLKYMMDSAYWIYIIHLPVVAFVPGLMANASFSPALKFFITLFATILVCFTSYHLLIRGTWIEKFLNGRANNKKQEASLQKEFIGEPGKVVAVE
jgi:glucans biosynthesis protein C